MWSFGNTIRCPWVFLHRVNAVNMSRSLTLPMTWLKNDYRWGTRSLHEALRQRPLFQIAACPAKCKFIQLWWDVMWFPYQTGSYFTWPLNQKSGMILPVPFVESLNSNKHSNLHRWAESVVKSSVGVNLVFPSFLDLYRFPSNLKNDRGCQIHDLQIVTISFTENPQDSFKIWKRFLDFRFVNSLVFFKTIECGSTNLVSNIST